MHDKEWWYSFEKIAWQFCQPFNKKGVARTNWLMNEGGERRVLCSESIKMNSIWIQPKEQIDGAAGFVKH